MATEVYKTKNIILVDDRELELSPSKIKYLRMIMNYFDNVRNSQDDIEAITHLTECARFAMKQFCPEIAVSPEVFENYVDIHMVYEILDVAAGIKINEQSEDTVKKQAVKGGSAWEDLDLAQLEAEVFLLGIWKDYEELEKSLSMAELMKTLEVSRDADYSNKKFLAAMQGVDLDKNTKKSNAWEEMKARVFSGGASGDPNDILAYQGTNAQKAGFGIGMGLQYERVD